MSLLQKDGFVIPEAIIGNPVLGKIKSFCKRLKCKLDLKKKLS